MKRYVWCVVGVLACALAMPVWGGTIIVDDTDPGCSLSGTWADNLGKNPEGKGFSGTGCVNANYRYTSAHGAYKKTGKEKAVWTPNLPKAGSYKVEVTFRQSENRSKKVIYEVTHSGGTARKTINQQESGKVTLGIFSFPAGKEARVAMVSDGGGSASIDSAQFSLVGAGEVPSTDSGATPGTTDTTGLDDILGGASDYAGDALIHLTNASPGDKNATLASAGKIEAKVCLRTYAPASLKVAVNGKPWITWTRANDADSSPCEADGKNVEESIFMEKSGDPSAREVTLIREGQAGDLLEASLEGGDGAFVKIRLLGQETSKNPLENPSKNPSKNPSENSSENSPENPSKPSSENNSGRPSESVSGN